jgi:AraC family transcriptional regulator of adaptative response/methylated-DNA-[protein]-cysteine methyltransferase
MLAYSTPPKYLRNGFDYAKKKLIHIVIRNTYYGSILVAYTEHGICSIQLGGKDNGEFALLMLRRDFPDAVFVDGTTQHENWINSVYAFVDGNTEKYGQFPLDIYGTQFQKKVWSALLEIPMGEVCSYTEVATKISSPKAVRAVATACASNKLAIVIPCHRVVRKDGSISGYKWGIELKQALLNKERANYVMR